MGAYFSVSTMDSKFCTLCVFVVLLSLAGPSFAGTFGFYTTDTLTTLPTSLDEFDLWYPNPYYWSTNILSSRTSEFTYGDSTYTTYWNILTTGIYDPRSSGYFSPSYFEDSASSVVLPLGLVTFGALLGAM